MLFRKAENKLLNPIKRTIYIPKKFVGIDLLESGYSALAEYSMLNAPNVKCYATEKISQWNDVMTNSLQDSQVQVAVEMWRYNPRKLSTRNMVDALSLALALREDADERVEEAVEEIRSTFRFVNHLMPSMTACDYAKILWDEIHLSANQ